MANFERIQQMQDQLGDGREPEWVTRTKLEDGRHLSGYLRELADQIDSNEIGSLDDLADQIAELFEEIAETLDDAHEEWLEMQV